MSKEDEERRERSVRIGPHANLCCNDCLLMFKKMRSCGSCTDCCDEKHKDFPGYYKGVANK